MPISRARTCVPRLLGNLSFARDLPWFVKEFALIFGGVAQTTTAQSRLWNGKRPELRRANPRHVTLLTPFSRFLPLSTPLYLGSEVNAPQTCHLLSLFGWSGRDLLHAGFNLALRTYFPPFLPNQSTYVIWSSRTCSPFPFVLTNHFLLRVRRVSVWPNNEITITRFGE